MDKTESLSPTWKKIATYLVFTFAFSTVFYIPLIQAGTMAVAGGLYVLGIMWSPGLAAIVTQLIFTKSLRGLGWGWGKTRFQLYAYAIPLLYAFAAYALVWITGLGGAPNNQFLIKAASNLGIADQSTLVLILGVFVYQGTVGVATSCISALGEEIGWRGFLVPHLSTVMSFDRTALLSGAIWAVWHFPGILFTDYHGSSAVWYSLLCFTVMVMGISYLFAWLRLKSGSLWTAMILHASHNLFIQGFFDPITVDRGMTGYVIGEFGAGLAIAGIVVALVVRRNSSGLTVSQST